ncbi:MAG: DUF362 domain-containing protein [Planctomycetes bacterium]|nr:DUF362 domain-containing protein [Planctomycetota bacterium]
MAQANERISRRRFLRRSGGLIATAGLCRVSTLWAQAQRAADPSSAGLAGPAGRRSKKSVVVRTQSDFVADVSEIRTDVMVEMFDSALMRLANTDTVAGAWAHYLRADDIVALKFNPHGERDFGTARPFARMIVESLLGSGWSAEQIVLVDAPNGIERQFGTRPPQLGWSAVASDFGSGRDRLAAFLEQVTAIVNIPYLKNDNIMGLSGCLKNITYRVVKHPARLHSNGCSPFLADILALPEVSGKLRLNIMNALRIAYHGGPLVTPNYVESPGLLLLGRDPIAVDAVALGTLNDVRRKAGLRPIPLDAEHVPALIDAAGKGLGQVNFRMIERLTAESI